MAAKGDRKLPNVQDPLSEPTVNRRLWAAYLRAGFNRSTFAKELGVSFVAVDKWDTGESQPSIKHLAIAAPIVGLTMDELVYGHRPPELRNRAEPELSREQIKLLLLDATSEQIEALGKHQLSSDGHYQRFTRAYVLHYIEAFAAARARGSDFDSAMLKAKHEASNARAQADAVARGIRDSISSKQLDELGKRVRARTGTHKRPPPRTKR